MSCPLCGSDRLSLHFQGKVHRQERDFLICSDCDLVHVPSCYHFSDKDEKAIYDLHENSLEDEGYKKHLHKLTQPLMQHLVAPSKGLDFGCGPGPLLKEILVELGHSIALYDKFYYPQAKTLDRVYDFVTATEVVEHVFAAQRLFDLFAQIVKPHGFLGLMTKMRNSQQEFAKWHYKNDPTHVLFFSRATVQWIAARWGWQIRHLESEVVILQKA